jgi:DNA-binding LacI/PurR family transcriptional regulator
MPKASRGASLLEVAALAEVSIQTVSNVLNSPHRVKPKTRERVLKAVETLEYIPNLSARRLRSEKSSSIAVRLDPNSSDEANPRGLLSGYIQDEFVFRLVEAAKARGIKVIVYTVNSGESELSTLKTFLQSRDVDGIILTSTVEKDQRLDFLKSKNAPFLSFGRPWGAKNLFSTSNPWIDIDGHKGTASATQMFWDKGFRKIGFVGWEGENPAEGVAHSTGEDRYLGWWQTLSHLLSTTGVQISKDLEVSGVNSIASGRECARKLLERTPDIEAVVCVSDTMAFGCLLEFQKNAHNHVEVSGFDNSPVSSEFGFSSLDQNLSDVAESALKVLMGATGNQIRKVDFAAEATDAHILLAPKLVIR